MEEATFGEVPFQTIFWLPEDDDRAFEGDKRIVFSKIVGITDHTLYNFDGVSANTLYRRAFPDGLRKLTMAINLQDSVKIIVCYKPES